MSVQEQLVMQRAIAAVEEKLQYDFAQALAVISERIDDLTAELDRVKELVKTFAVDAPEKVDPIRIPAKPKTLKTMFPDPKGDAAA